MSGDDNIHDEDEAVFDEDFIVDQDDASGSKQPEDAADDPPAEQPGQPGAGFSAWEGEGDGDHDEEPAFDDDEGFVLEDEPAAVPTVTAGQPLGLDDDEDEGFVLEDEAAPAAAFAADQSGILGSEDEDEDLQQEKLETTASHPEEGDLFDAGPVSSENEFDVGDERHFMEKGGSGWDGDDTDPETLGVTRPLPPVESPILGDAQELLDADAATMEIEQDPELELVEFDADLDTPAAVPVFQVEDDADEFDADPVLVLEGAEDGGESDADPVFVLEDAEDDGESDVDPVLVLEDAEDAYGSEAEPALALGSRDDAAPGEGWEPLDAPTSLDDDGAPEPYQGYEHEDEQELHVGPEPRPDYAKQAAQSVDQHEIPEAPEHHVVGAMEPLPRRPWRGLLAVAATILVIGLAGVAYVKPQAFLDVFGVKPEKVEVLKISRPGIDVDITVPDVDINIEPEPPVVTPVVKPPVVKPVVKPPVVKPPVVKPVVKPPVRPVPYRPVAPPAPNPGVHAVQLNEDDRIPFGKDREDGYMKGTRKGTLSMSSNPEILRRELDLLMGSKALAQLMNNNIFFGRVKALDSLFVTLRLDRGEVSLPLTDIRVLTHLAFDEYQSLKRQGKAGFVYLRNNNRLGGLIVAQRDDSVILQVKSNRVIIPKSEIERIQETETRTEVQFSAEDSLEDDDWLRRLVEEQLSKQPAKRIKDPGTVSIDPDSTSTPEGKR